MSDDYDDDLFNAYNEASDAKPPMDQQDNYDEEFADALDTAVPDNTSEADPSSSSPSGMDIDRQRQQQNRHSSNPQQQQQRYYQQQQQQSQQGQQQPNVMMGGMPMSYQMALAYQQQMQQYMAANPLQFQMMQQQYRQMQQQQQQQAYQQQRRPYQQQSYQRQGNVDEQSSEGKMFIGGLNWDTTDEGLKEYFGTFGEVASCTVMRDPATGQSRGFGFLTMVDPENVTKVLNQADHHLDGKKIDPKRAVSRSEQAQQQQQQQQQQSSSSPLPERSEKIFVGGISSDVDQDEFRAFFERFGAVAEATLMVDRESGRPRGFGFITFEEASAVERALEATDLVIKDKQVEIKRAMPKTKRMPGSVRPPPNSRYAGAAMGGMMYPAGNAAAQTNPYAAMAAAYYGRMNGGTGNSYQQQDQDNHHHHQHRRPSGGDDDDDDDRRRHYSRDRDHHHHSSSSSSSRRHRDSSRDDRYHRSSSRQPYDDRTGGGAVHASSSTRNQSSYRPY